MLLDNTYKILKGFDLDYIFGGKSEFTKGLSLIKYSQKYDTKSYKT